MGQNQSSIRREIAIGIDLGTTYSCVAVWKDGIVEIIPNEQGNRITPSWVSFNKDECLIGEGAKNLSASNPSNTIFDAKRLIGRRFTNSNVQSDMSLWPFKVVTDTVEDKPMIAVKYKGEERLFSPEDISAMVLSKMKENSEKFLGCEVKNAVVSVPAYFNGSQRLSTRKAATIAGLNVLRIINEPSAAALAYAQKMHNKSKKTVLIFDLGGGTFDVSLVEIEHGIVVVKATAGDTHLGGQDFDNLMVEKLFDAFKREHGMDESREARARSRLKSECERAKRSLSSCLEETVFVECLYKDIDLHVKFTRVQFEELNMDLFKRCITIMEGCLKNAKIDKDRIDDVVLVGGSTRIPKVQKMLRNFFKGKALCHRIHTDEVVAYGAAIQAAMLVEEPSLVPKMVLKDVTPLSLGWEKNGKTMNVVIPRNSPIPKEESIITVTSEDNQTSISFDIYEGERIMARDNNFIGGFTLEGICPKPAYTSRSQLVFNVDEDGILTVSARDLDSGKEARMTTKGFATNEAISKMLADAEIYKFEDVRQRRIAEAKGKLRRFAYTIRNTIREPNNASKLSRCETYAMERKCAGMIQWLKESSSTIKEHEYEKKKKELDEFWEEVRVKLSLSLLERLQVMLNL